MFEPAAQKTPPTLLYIARSTTIGIGVTAPPEFWPIDSRITPTRSPVAMTPGKALSRSRVRRPFGTSASV